MKRSIKRIESMLNAGESTFLNSTSKLFTGVLSETESILRRAKRQGEIQQDFVLPGRKRYLALFEELIYGVYSAGAVLAGEELQAKRAKQRGFSATTEIAQFDDDDYMPSVVAITDDAVIPKRAVNWMDEWTQVFGNDYYDDLTRDAVTVIQNGLDNGYSVPDVMKALEVVFSGEGFNKSRLETIARTNATTAFNQGRLHTFEANSDFVKAVQILAVLDSRTTDVCESRNGKILRLDDPKLKENTPPFHYRCRTILSPITAPEWAELQRSGELADAMNWSNVEKPEKGFGDVNKALRDKAEERESRHLAEAHEINKKVSGNIGSNYEKRTRKDKEERTDGKARTDFIEYKENKSVMLIQFETPEINQQEFKATRKAITEVLTELPESHIDGLNGIEVTNQLLVRVDKKDVAHFAKGFYSTENKTITISRFPSYSNINEKALPADIKRNLYHEVAHYYEKEKLSKNSELKSRFHNLHSEVLRNRSGLNNMGFLTETDVHDFNEFFADLYRQRIVKYDIIIRVDDQFPGLNIKSLIDEVFGG